MAAINNRYYIGIDIDDLSAVISFFQTGMHEPETVSLVAGSEVFQIPLLLVKKRGIGQWFIGEEARRMAMVQDEEPVDKLLSKALLHEQIEIERETYAAEELLVLYIKKLILAASRLGNPGLPDKLVVTTETLSRELTDLFFYVGEKLGLEREQITLLDRKECFYYFTLNQQEDIWLHDVCLYDYRDGSIKCCLMQRNLKTMPQVVTITEEVRSLSENHRDESFYKILQENFRGHIISAVYLVGENFEGDWMKLSLAFMCRGRRAFIGKNLYSKGACYAAAVLSEQSEWPYIYMGDNEMKVNISLKVKNRGNLEFLTLISAGENWYEASKECEVLLDGTPEIDFWLQLPNSREAKVEKLELADLPERKNKTTRLRIHAKPLSDTNVMITIRDLGFGEIVKSSDQTWEYVMSI